MAETPEPSREPANRRTNEIDSTGITVAANVRRLRTELQMTTGQLAARLEAMGRPIIANAITKIEQGRRRVDVDDLMALAIALDVTPNALLLPHDLKEKAHLTGARSAASGSALWVWANGVRPLQLAASPVGVGESGSAAEANRRERFTRQAAPHSRAPEQVFIHGVSISRTLEAMTGIVETTPVMTKAIEEQAERFAAAWSKVVAAFARNEEDPSDDAVTSEQQAARLEDLMSRVHEILGE